MLDSCAVVFLGGGVIRHVRHVHREDAYENIDPINDKRLHRISSASTRALPRSSNGIHKETSKIGNIYPL